MSSGREDFGPSREICWEFFFGVVTQMRRVRQRRGVNEFSLEDAYRCWADELVGYASVLVPFPAAADVVADTFADLLVRSDGGW